MEDDSSSEDEEGEERTGLTGEGASAVHSDMVEDGLGLGAEAGHLYTGCVPDEVMCPRQPSSEPSPPTPASQTSRRERSGGGSSATAKRREAFAGRRADGEGVTEAGGSFQSDSHSPASHSSIDSLLESRRPDPEEMLFGLGFGGHPGGASLPSQGSGGGGGGGPGSVSGSQRGAPSPFPFGNCGNDTGSDEEVSRIPRRFLQPSKVKGVAINDFFKYQQDLIETFESGFCGYRGLTGPSHTVPSVIVAKIMEKLREHERENSSRGSVASFGTGPNCHSPTPPPTPPFSPTSPMIGSPLDDERLQFLQPQPLAHSPIISPVESQPTTTKFSKVARNVMHRTSILTRMSSIGGESVASTDDASGSACSPTSRASLSVLTPDNRKFLDSQGSKSPELPKKRMIIGQRSFTFDHDGDLIEDLSPPEETPTSPTALPPKPPLVHKDSVISSVTSLTSCDSDSDTDSAPNFRRSTSARSSGGRTLIKSRASASNSSDSAAPTGPWPLGKRMSSTSLSSWEEVGDGHGSSSNFAPLGQRPRFLSIDEGDNEGMEGQEEVRQQKWILGNVDEHGKEEWLSVDEKQEREGHMMETGSSEGGSHEPTMEAEGGLGLTRESSVHEGLWELELDLNESGGQSGVVADAPKVISPPSSPSPPPPILEPFTVRKSDVGMEMYPKTVISSVDVFKVVDQDCAIVESNPVLSMQEDQGEEIADFGKGEVLSEGSVSQEYKLPSVSSLSNFSSCSSVQESSASSHNVRRGSLKRQTKFDIEEETVIVDSTGVDMAVDALNETPRVLTPISHSEEVSMTEPSQQVSEVSSVVAEPVLINHSSSAVKVEEMPSVSKGDSEFQQAERHKRALSPHGRSGSAHSDSSGFLEWEPPGAKVTAMPLSPPARPLPPTPLGGIGKGKEWSVTEESSQLPSPDGGTTVGSSAYYGVEGISSEVTGQQLQADTVELALRALRRNLEEDGESTDGTGREVALGGGNWRGAGLANIGEASSEGLEEETLQLAHQELGFVREMRCCVSEGMERVMQFLGTWGKHRHNPCHTHIEETDGDSAKVSSIMSQMTFLLKQQSKLCYEMEQLSMQRLLDGQLLGVSSCKRFSEVKGGTPMLGIKEGEREGTMVIHGKGGMKGNLRSQSASPQYSTESGASSREHYLEGIVEQNARELAELKLLLKTVLTPTNQNDRG